MAVDPDAGLLVTSVFTNVGTSSAPVYDLRVMALNAADGQVAWSAFAGQGPSLDGFKAGNPMIHAGAVYLGNPLSATVQSYDLATGALRWRTSVASSDPAVRIAPRAAPVLADGKLLLAAQRHVFTFDPATGALLNDFYNPYPYAAYGLNQPVVVGRQVYLSSVSGYVQYWPLDTLTTTPEPPTETVPALPLKTAEYYDSSARPTSSQSNSFPTTALAYAGGPAHNSYLAGGPSLKSNWSRNLVYGLPLSGAPHDASIFGQEIAAHMTHFSFGAGSGVATAKGMVYVAGTDRTVQAFNGVTGKLVWRFRTNNLNFGQPLVTSNAVIVTGGNLGLNLGNYGNFTRQSAQTRTGTGFMYVHALDPNNGNEKWTFYAGQGSMSMTPLHDNGTLYWVDGQSRVWAISAATGQPAAPFMDANGLPVLSLGGGFNAVSSPNLYIDSAGRRLMIVGLTMPNRLVAIDLATAAVAWTQSLAGFFNHITGLGTTSVAVDQASGLVVGSTVVEADFVLNNARLLAFALNGTSGDVVWTRRLDPGPVPAGYVAATPMIANNRVFLANPVAQQTVSLELATGAPRWQTAVALTAGSRYSWAPGVWIPSSNRLLQPMGSELVSFNADTGAVIKRTSVGGAMTFNHPTVLGPTLYIGNSYGWLLAYKLSDVGG
jgi:outer membrane protein assembly factor BamB